MLKMNTRMSCFAFAAMIMISATASLRADSFEQSVTGAFVTLRPQMSSLNQCLQDSASQVQDINAQSDEYQSATSPEEAEFAASHGGGSHGGGGGNYHPPAPHPGPVPHPTPTPHPTPGPHPQPVPHHGGNSWGPGHWDNWHHPGWGTGRWAYRDGRWMWWGWARWSGVGMCDAYYYGMYRNCSNDVQENYNLCRSNCAGIEECNEQCAVESENAVNACEYSYRGYWNCGYPAIWPPVGVVIWMP
jgi:hypothetical protein